MVKKMDMEFIMIIMEDMKENGKLIEKDMEYYI